MNQEFIKSILQIFTKQRNSKLFIILGISITTSTVIALMTLFLVRENPNNVFKDYERVIMVNESNREFNQNSWQSNMNFKLLKEFKAKNTDIEELCISNNGRTIFWINGNKLASNFLYADDKLGQFVNFEFIQGSYFTSEQHENESKVIVISKKLKESLFTKENVIGESIEVLNQFYTVIGVYQNLPDMNAMQLSANPDFIISYKHDALKLRETDITESSYNYNAIYKINDLDHIASVKKNMINLCSLFEIKPDSFKLYISPYTVKDDFYTKRYYSGGKNNSMGNESYEQFLISGILIIILTVICIVNVGNLLLTSFLNRNTEFGVRMAFGAQNNDLYKQLIVETFIYTVLSLIFTYLFANILFFILEKSELFIGITYSFKPLTSLIIFLYCFLIPFLSGFFAFKKIINQKPITLLKGGLL